MKKKFMICFLMLALVIGSTSAMAAPKIGSVTGAGGATLSLANDGKSVSVRYPNAVKDTEYVVMVVAEDAVDATAGVPTKNSINNNQNHEIVYMDQRTADSNDAVLFEVYPDLEGSSAGDKFGIFLSGTGLNMSNIGEFTLDELLAMFGDVNGDNLIDYNDAICILKFKASLEMPNVDTTSIESVGNVNGDAVLDYNDAIYILKFKAGIEGYNIG